MIFLFDTFSVENHTQMNTKLSNESEVKIVKIIGDLELQIRTRPAPDILVGSRSAFFLDFSHLAPHGAAAMQHR